MQAFALIKFFSEEQHLRWLRDGSLMFRTPHYYRRCEDAGRGDRDESCILYRDKKLGDDMPFLSINRPSFDVSSIESILLHPSSEPSDSWMQSWCVVGKFNDFELSLSRMLDEFGCYFALLPASKIESYAESLQRATGLNVSYGFMRYTGNALERSLCVKDEKFEYQKEFRFYVGMCDKYEVLDKQIHLTGMPNLLSQARSLKFESPNGDIIYCSTGSKTIVQAR